ncbi:peptidoglycan DD-metalloendopeptidase family protein [Clostridium perfringens]|nr:peptidoglycan DD-metalloendopeptidase family protein [Clostridium perfringens]EJT6532499.1 peptidoglycan DD-metalloendopeptidase family protein [Clostridium perfringens]
MDIQVYNWENTNFEFNGDRTLCPYSCELIVRLNGICEIELEHPYDLDKSWTYLETENVIAAPTPWSDKQLFRIYDFEKTITGLKVYARHIYFDSAKYNIESNLHIKNKNGQEALNLILKNTPFKAYSNITDINDCYFFKNNVIEGIAGNKENCFLNRWGGELFLDNYNIHINYKIGSDEGIRVSYGNNLEDLSLKRSTEGVFTRLYPYVIKNTTDTIELPEKFVDSKNISKYPNIYEKYINLSEFMHLKNGDDDKENAYETLDQLYTAMRNKCREIFAKGIDTPKTSGTVNMAILENTTEYEHVKELVHVNLGDDIIVDHYDIGVESSTRCVGYRWNCITKKYLKIDLGELEKDFFDFQSSTTHDLNNILNLNGTVNPSMLEGIISATKTKFTALRDVAQPQHQLAMLFEDRIKGSSTYGACAIGSMGLMIASKRLPDDSDWDWNTFIGGGFAMADWLIGKLKTVLIQNMDASFEIDLNKTGGALFRNNGKDAILIENNMIKLFNWKKNGDFIGGLMALIKGDDENKPLIGLSNDIDSALALGYAKKDSISVPSYIEFDKYNILEDSGGKPVRIYEEVDFKGNKVYNIDIRSDNGKNNIMVGDHYINLTTENNEIVISDRGVRIGKKNTFYYDANSGDITLNGVIKNSNGQVILDPNNAGIGGGGIDNIGNVSKGIPSRKYFRYVKGIEGLQQYPGNIGDGQITYGYGVTKANEPTYFAKLGPAPCSEETASKVLFELIPDKYGSLVKNQMLKDGVDLNKVPIHIFDAFVDLCYNAGYYNSRMYRAWIKGASLDSIYNDWLTYATMPGTIFEKGLKRRRKEEAEMFKNANYIMSPISILNAHGGQIGTVKGDGYFPSFTGFKTVNNAYGNGWIIPVTGGQVTATFPSYSSGAPHSGIDFGVPEGTPVRVSKDGTVIKRRELTTSYGKYLFIDHGDGLVTIYAHNSQLLVSEGQHVTAGQIIAKSGNTGNSTGPHCHWELRVNGVAQNVAPSLRIGDHV